MSVNGTSRVRSAMQVIGRRPIQVKGKSKPAPKKAKQMTKKSYKSEEFVADFSLKEWREFGQDRRLQIQKVAERKGFDLKGYLAGLAEQKGDDDKMEVDKEKDLAGVVSQGAGAGKGWERGAPAP